MLLNFYSLSLFPFYFSVASRPAPYLGRRRRLPKHSYPVFTRQYSREVPDDDSVCTAEQIIVKRARTVRPRTILWKCTRIEHFSSARDRSKRTIVNFSFFFLPNSAPSVVVCRVVHRVFKRPCFIWGEKFFEFVVYSIRADQRNTRSELFVELLENC